MRERDNLLNGMLIGAGMMYLLDPDRGRRRRAVIRDQFVHLLHKTDDAMDTAARDLRNRSWGVVAEAASRVRPDRADDPVVEARVRSALGRLVTHPGAIHVRVSEARAFLSGPVLEGEVAGLIAGVRAVRGVKEVVDQLDPHREAGEVPGLQGHGRRPRPRTDILQENWSPATRAMIGMLGGTMLLRGMRGTGITDPIAGLIGAGLLTRAVSNLRIRRLLGVDAGRRAIDIHKIITIQAPVDEVFDFWSNYENFPLFMSHLREVRRTAGERSHWVAEGPGGIPFEWDAETTLFEENRVIAWKSIGSSSIQNAGIVRFQEAGEGATRVDVRMSYNPPAGAIGHAVAAFLGSDPKHLMDEDLVRLKSLLENGKTTAHHHPVIREEVRRAMHGDGRGQIPLM